jgi:hypothetical protein
MMILAKNFGDTVKEADITFSQTQSESCNYYLLWSGVLNDRIMQALVTYTE